MAGMTGEDRPSQRPAGRMGEGNPRAGTKSASDLAILFAGQIGSRAMGFFAFALLARVLTPSDYGLVETAVGMAAIGLWGIEFGTNTVGIRRIVRGEAPAADVALAVTSARIMLALVVIPVLLLAYIFLLRDRAPATLFLLFGVSLVAVVARYDWLFMAQERMGIAAGGSVTKMAAFLAAVLLLSFRPPEVVVVGWAECGAMALMVVFFLAADTTILKVYRRLPAFHEGISMLRESFSLGVSGLLNTAMMALPMLIVATLATARESGELAAAIRIVVSLATFGLIYYQNLTPLLLARMQRAPDETQRIIDASDTVVAWAGAGVAVFLCLTAEALVIRTFGEKLAGAAAELTIVAWCIPLTLASGAVRLVLVGQGHQRSVLFAQLLGALVTIGTALLLSARGAEGGAIGVILGQVTLWAAMLWPTRHCVVRSRPAPYAAPTLVALALVFFSGRFFAEGWLAGGVGLAIVVMIAVATPRFRQSVWALSTAKQG
ncbi:MAG: oligosaccharide flippase family protein [Hyphomicrobiales bacterium]|nr:oligosaccharide flippase family protein [Hyphomicrobiales bacterium]